MIVKEQDFNKYLKMIDSIDIAGFKEWELKPILYYPSYNMIGKRLSVFGQMKSYIGWSFRYKYVCKGKGNIGFFIGIDSSFRNDFLKQIEDCSNLLKDDERYVIYAKRSNHINWWIFHLPFWMIRWGYAIRKYRIPFSYKIFWGINLHRFMMEKDMVLKYANPSTKLWVTFCDVCPTEAILIQYFNKHNVDTATLQHGHFNANDRGWVFNLSRSKHFIAHGGYAEAEAKKAGVESNRLLPLGIVNFINRRNIMKGDESNSESNLFGLLLNGPGAREDNEGIIKLANEISNRIGIKYVVRCHPAIPYNTYHDCYDLHFCNGECGKITLEDFLDSVKFALVGNSTVFIEVLSRGKVPYRYSKKTMDIYDRIDWCKVTSINEFIKKYKENERLDHKEKINSTLEFLCGKGSVKENYYTFFEKYLIE